MRSRPRRACAKSTLAGSPSPNAECAAPRTPRARIAHASVGADNPAHRGPPSSRVGGIVAMAGRIWIHRRPGVEWGLVVAAGRRRGVGRACCGCRAPAGGRAGLLWLPGAGGGSGGLVVAAGRRRGVGRACCGCRAPAGGRAGLLWLPGAGGGSGGLVMAAGRRFGRLATRREGLGCRRRPGTGWVAERRRVSGAAARASKPSLDDPARPSVAILVP